ncbi:5-methyltetrahydropteroyltriglutamate--homocysteine S-methyltransferase [Lacticaseibacillus daqingensis]|uniref:5-methyltetrahydropteroyltriglutamate-- homocysteine S-methyltransferase n=1 Tax=Lacticaseibacillus daqingensis TaxID=2486014 RepID=UPI000F77BA37|nr:5-methyltetrahydropteroyltriglutamate--homocysteine S-methyltransferase [Lacticaseibacillus daqingensis]
MTNTTHAPFHADLVGSLLRPATLKQANADLAAGRIDAAAALAVQHSEIKRVVDSQVALGFKAVTDGEFSRQYWHLDFLWGLTGVDPVLHATYDKNFEGDIAPVDNAQLTGPVGYNPDHPFFAAFSYLNSIVPDGVLAKQTIPTPSLLLRDHRSDNWADFYPTPEAFEDAIIAAYVQTIQHFYDLGCRYLQIDDTNWAYLIHNLRQTENDPAAAQPFVTLAERAHRLLAGILAQVPADLTVTSHICRGNFQSTYLFTGGYEYVAEYLKDLPYDGLFLEYDNPRSGSFAPLKTIWNGDANKTLVLGVITSKFPDLEAPAQITHRLDEAQVDIPLANLALSTQCGFASTQEGNKLTEAQQWAKLQLVQSIAQSVWG